MAKNTTKNTAKKQPKASGHEPSENVKIVAFSHKRVTAMKVWAYRNDGKSEGITAKEWCIAVCLKGCDFNHNGEKIASKQDTVWCTAADAVRLYGADVADLDKVKFSSICKADEVCCKTAKQFGVKVIPHKYEEEKKAELLRNSEADEARDEFNELVEKFRQDPAVMKAVNLLKSKKISKGVYGALIKD